MEHAGRPTHGSFWRASGHTLLLSAGSVAVTLLTTVALARILGPSAKGAYDLVLASAALFGTVLGLSLASGVTYGVARGFAAPRSLVGALVALVAVQSLSAGVIVAAIRSTPLGSALVPDGLSGLAAVAVALFVGSSLLTAHARAVLIGRQKIETANWRDFWARVALGVAVVLVALVVRGEDSERGEAVIWAAVAGNTFGLGLMAWAVLRNLGPRGPRGLHAIAAFAVPSAAANTLQFLNYRLDLFLVGLFLGITQVGLYAVAAVIGQLIWLLSQSAATVLLPRIAASDRPVREAAKEAAIIARLMFMASTVLALLVAGTASTFVPLVFGARFADGVPAILCLLPGVALFAPVNVLGAFMAGIGRPDLNLAVSAVGFVLTLALDLALIPTAGIVGAAIASTTSYGASAVIMFVLFRRASSIGSVWLLAPTRDDARLIANALGRIRT